MNISVGKTELYHNAGSPASGRLGNFYTLNRTANMPVQGDGESSRNGDRIYLSGFQVNMLCGQKYDRPNVTWKIIVVLTPKGTTCNMDTLFRYTSGNLLLDPLNMDYVKRILYYKTLKPAQSTMASAYSIGTDLTGYETNTNTREYTFPHKFWISRKKEYKFQFDNGTTHGDDDVVMFVGVYDAYGTLITDNIAYFDTYVKVAYRDP